MNENSSDQAKELSIKAVEVMEKGVEYADVLCEKAQGVRVIKDNAEERVSTPASFQGVVLRAYKMGQWRETGTYDLSARRVVEMARKLARFEPLSRNSVKLKELNSTLGN
jgi:predicted Zn-dependent protease